MVATLWGKGTGTPRGGLVLHLTDEKNQADGCLNMTGGWTKPLAKLWVLPFEKRL